MEKTYTTPCLETVKTINKNSVINFETKQRHEIKF